MATAELLVNDDRCLHVPTAPGQRVCTCLDERMWLRFVIQVQAEVIRQLQDGHPMGPVNLMAP
jgi:hypothetical protein